MSTHIAEVVRYVLRKHDNADALSVATVKGWEVVVKTEDFINNISGLGVYIPPDMIASANHPLLGFLEGKRIKPIRLRGVFSQGILLPLSKVAEVYNLHYIPAEGSNLSTLLEVKRWEEPLSNITMLDGGKGPNGESVDTIKGPDWFSKYTDIENFNNYPNEFKKGEIVEVTDKIEGTSAKFCLYEMETYISSMNRVLRTKPIDIKIPRITSPKVKHILNKLRLRKFFNKVFTKTITLEVPTSVWHKAFQEFNILEALVKIGLKYNTDKVAIYGEIANVQKGFTYGKGKGEIDFYLYDVRVYGHREEDNNYLSPEELDEVAELTGLKKVPTLYWGPYNENVIRLSDGLDPIDPSHVREGIVIKPAIPRAYRKGRLVLKKKGEEYLLGKGKKK